MVIFLTIPGTAKPVKHVTDNTGKTVTATTRGLNKTVTGATGGLKSTITDSTTAAGNADILGLGSSAVGGVGKTVSGTGRGLVSVPALKSLTSF
jgi:hypothetical protein